MSIRLNQALLDRIVAKTAARRHIFGAVFHLSSGDGGTELIGASGEIGEDDRYYIASINKLFVSAIILRMWTDNKLDLQDRISAYLPEETVPGLHVYRGKDYSETLTIAHLLSHTSGLPCYLADRQAGGKRAMTELESGIDQPWPADKMIEEVKKMKPHFPPGTEGKAKYTDTNYRILSMIVEGIAGERISSVLEKLFRELGLDKTHVCRDDKIDHVPIRYKKNVVRIPQFLASTGDDIISTAGDQMTFIRSFFSGFFFPVERLGELQKWNRIFFPFQYGIGIQKFHLPRIFSPFYPVPDMIGHCGSTGSAAFFVPDLDLYITGTINQQARPNVAFQAMLKIIRKYR